MFLTESDPEQEPSIDWFYHSEESVALYLVHGALDAYSFIYSLTI